MSGFKGAHRTDKRHVLAQFLELVERGRVPRGSWLIVEAVDRLGREDPAEVFPFVLSLIKTDIRIITLSPSEVVYEQGMDQSRMIVLLLETFRGHGESARKSDLCGHAWREKKRLAREEGKPLGKNLHPAWLAIDGDRYVLKRGAAGTVRMIYQLAAAGKGTSQITRELNDRNVPAFGKKGVWVRSYVQKILSDRSVLGEYRPCFGRHRKEADGDPIENFYPPAISLAEWTAARDCAATKATRLPRRRPPRVAHPFQGLLSDALDLCPMYTITLKARKYVVSQRGFDNPKGDTNRRPFPLDVLQSSLLSQMREIPASELFADPSAGRVAELEAKLSDVERKLTLAVSRFEADPDNSTWADRVDQYDRDRRQFAKDLAELRAEATNPLPAAWAEAVSLMNKTDPQRLAAVLRRAIEDIRVLVVKRGQTRLCAAAIYFAGVAVRHYLIRWTRSVVLPHCTKPEVIEVRSFAEAGLANIDLRNSEHVRKVEKLLGRLDLEL